MDIFITPTIIDWFDLMVEKRSLPMRQKLSIIECLD